MTEPNRTVSTDRMPREASPVDHATLTEVRDGLRNGISTTVYVVELGKPWGLDVAGVLMTPWGETLFSHVSSNSDWLRRDLTENFGRATKLASRFGAYDVVHVPLGTEIPAEIAAYVVPAAEHTDGEADTDG